MTQLENALWALQRGFKVFPLQYGSKEPNGFLVPHGSKEATTDEAKIREWWAKSPNGNVGICGGVIVDCDTGVASLKEAESWREKVGLPPTLAVRTGRRTSYGIQYHYTGQSDSSPYVDAHGVDGEIRSGNLYGVAPGSLHPDSKKLYALAIDLPRAEYPKNTYIEKCRKKTANHLAKNPKRLKPGEKIKRSSRQYWLVSQCGRLRNTGLKGEALFKALCALRDEYCDSPEEKTDEMVRQICESGERLYGVANPVAPSPEEEWFDEPSTPSEQAVLEDTKKLLRDVEDAYRRFVVLPEHALLPVALWTIATYCFDLFDCFPHLVFLSPQKRSGKTTASKILRILASRVLLTVQASAAALFRLVSKEHPTIVLDEVESLNNNKSEQAQAMLAILNASHERDGATVLRCNPSDCEKIDRFNVYSPKAFCAIGHLPGTTLDRSLIIKMQRCPRPSRFRARRAKTEFLGLKTQIKCALQDKTAQDEIRKAYDTLEIVDKHIESDRDCDNLEPLAALLSFLDNTRMPEFLKDSQALTRSKAGDDTDSTFSARLCADILGVLKDYKREGILTKDLHARLVGIDDSPWHEDKKFTTYRICQMLKPYSVKADFQWREGVETFKGLSVRKLLQALSPYSTRYTSCDADSKRDTEESTRYTVASGNAGNSFETNDVANVASEKQERGPGYVFARTEEGEL